MSKSHQNYITGLDPCMKNVDINIIATLLDVHMPKIMISLSSSLPIRECFETKNPKFV